MIPLLLLLAAAPVPSPESARVQTVATMHTALHAVIALQPYLASPVAFRDPKNRDALASELDQLSMLKHRFLKTGKQEPGAATFAGMFGEQVDRAREDLKAGNTEGARARLRGITSLCFACHTREAAKDFEDVGKRVESMGLPPLRLAEFLATTRQFDRAIATWKIAVGSEPANELEAFDQSSALRQLVAVLVRVKDDPKSTVALLTEQSGRASLAPFVRRMLSLWLQEAKAWDGEKFAVQGKSPAELFTKAKLLIESTGSARTPLFDEARFISSLRASGYLHLALEREPAAKFRGEALYLLAVSSAATRDPLLWELDTMYLEACIRENPHTALAVTCADRMYDRAWFGWTGSGGTEIPPDVAQRLGELRVLAEPVSLVPSR